MAERHKTRGIVLEKRDLREADQAFYIFSQDFGKIEVLGRAIRKIKSKLRAGIDIFYFSEIEFIEGKARKTLIDALAISKFKNIRGNLNKLKVANQVGETVKIFLEGQEKDDKIWELLYEIFNILDERSLSLEQYALLYYYFFWNFVSIVGYRIDLFNCAQCQKELFLGNLNFIPEEGGIACELCSGKENSRGISNKISPEVIKILRFIERRDWQIITRLKLDKSQIADLSAVSNCYLCHLKEHCN